MSSNASCIQTQGTLPACFFTRTASSRQQPHLRAQFVLQSAEYCEENRSLSERRLSSLLCSSSSGGSSSNFSNSRGRQHQAASHCWRGRQYCSRWQLPFASLSAQQSGASPGQLPWHPRSNSRLESPKPQQTGGATAAPELSPEDLVAAARAATTEDVFKQGDCIGPSHEGQGRYKLLYKLGRGPAGQAEGLGDGRFVTVWAVRDRAADSQAVVKVVEAGDATSYAAGAREAAVHALAGRHPNVVSLLDAFEHRSSKGRHAAMVLEQCGSSLDFVVHAHSLGSAVQQSGAARPAAMASAVEIPQLQDARALRHIAKHTLQGLAHLHSRGIAHMDVSADNIVLDKLFAWHNKHSLGGLLRSASQGWRRWLDSFVLKEASQGQQQQQQQQQQQHTDMLIEAARQRGVHTQHTLHTASLKLLDFGKAVPYRQLQETAKPREDGKTLAGPLVSAQLPASGPIIMGNPRTRPPEEVLGLEFVAPACDIWHFGCMMFELATGKGLLDQFDYHGIMDLIPKAARQYYGDDDCYLLEMTSVFGRLPKNLIHKSPQYKGFYMEQDDFLRVARYVGVPGGSGGRAVPKLLKKECDSLQDKEIVDFGKFLVDVLEVDPIRRPTADQLLQHSWLQDAA